MIRRLLCHVHTRRSPDSRIRPEQIIAHARRNHIECVIVTDHDTHLGSLDCARIAGSEGPTCPMASEYRSPQGEIIAAFLSEPIASRDPFVIIRETHAQGGLIILPHPFKGTHFSDDIFEQSDLIETFNSRTSDADNASAAALAKKLGKPTIAGADVHLMRELSLIVNEYEASGDMSWIELLRSRTPRFDARKTTVRAIRESQMIKACRQIEPVLFAKSLMRWVQASPCDTP